MCVARLSCRPQVQLRSVYWEFDSYPKLLNQDFSMKVSSNLVSKTTFSTLQCSVDHSVFLNTQFLYLVCTQNQVSLHTMSWQIDSLELKNADSKPDLSLSWIHNRHVVMSKFSFGIIFYKPTNYNIHVDCKITQTIIFEISLLIKFLIKLQATR